ncbi:MAG: DMT family transporter [Marinosulfonomonas sp.]|nr:DMT family transporter [Marinosulfonomonas sp.]
MTGRLWLVGVLVLLGAGWGITGPFAKIAVSGGYRAFGLIFWQFLIGAVLLGAVTALRGKGLPLGWPQLRLYILIAAIGTLLPNSSSYEAARYLPAGVISILLSLMPIFAFPIALAMGNDRFAVPRLAGLGLGLIGVLLLIGPPESLPERAMVAFVPLALVAPLCYGLEGNVVAKWGTFGCDPIQVLLGASIVGAIVAAPLAILSGQWISPHFPLNIPDKALIASSVINAFAYTTYVWLVGRAGSVFAAQTSYLVTAFGIGWAMLLLSEVYSTWIWIALALIFAGLFLVQPRQGNGALEPASPSGDDEP